MTEFLERKIVEFTAKSGPLPKSFSFGDGINWSSPLQETFLYVELPFWLMTPPGPVDVRWSDVTFTIDICSPWMEVFIGEVTDSRRSCLHQGPYRPDGYEPPEDIAQVLNVGDAKWLHRPCKTMLRFTARAHADVFHAISEDEPPRAKAEQEAYFASLCEAHLPVVNELIQRYRLITYDYFAYEVSPWDVPVWYLKHLGSGYHTVLLPYKTWDAKPVIIEDSGTPGGPPKFRPFEWATPAQLTVASSDDATPGEFDLLDARSLMERGDYTGAVRRTVTAIEAVVAWALLKELETRHPLADANRRLANTDNDFPGRLAQWRRLSQPAITQQEFDEFQTTRQIRHDIVHRSRRLLHGERGRAQRAVDTGRWLFNKIEAKPDRAQLRDKGTLKSVGRTALAPRFPFMVDADGIFLSHSRLEHPQTHD
jgi:hypothetical protein